MHLLLIMKYLYLITHSLAKTDALEAMVLHSISIQNNAQLLSTATFKPNVYFVYENCIRDLLYSPKPVSLYKIRDVSLAWNTFKQGFLHISDVDAPIQSQRVKVKVNRIIEMVYKNEPLT